MFLAGLEANPLKPKPKITMTMKKWKTPLAQGILAVTFVSLWAPSTEGIVRRDDVDDQDYIDFGAQFPSVGEFATNGSIRGSGVLISEAGAGESRWVLTAAHLATPNEFTIGDTLYAVSEFIRHPDWDADGGPLDTGVEDDIALARLDTVVSGVTPLPWHDNDGDLLPGVEVDSVGFGRTGTGLTGEQSGTSGTKRAAQNTIETLGTTAPLTPPESAFEYVFNEPGSADVRDLEGMGVLYDSGGPALADFGDGPVVVGIHSYVIDQDDQGRGTYGDVMGSTRVPLYDDWIASTIPEPGTWGLLSGFAVFAAVAVWRRRRS